jgi:hypothetical protein
MTLRVVTRIWRAGDLLLPLRATSSCHRCRSKAGWRDRQVLSGCKLTVRACNRRVNGHRSVQSRQIFALGCHGRAPPSASVFIRFCTIGCILPVQLITQGRADRTRALRAPCPRKPTGRRARGSTGASLEQHCDVDCRRASQAGVGGAPFQFSLIRDKLMKIPPLPGVRRKLITQRKGNV